MKLRLKKREPNGPLRELCIAVPEGKDEKHLWTNADRAIMLEMARHMLKDKLHGLSANQLGVNIRMFATNVPGDIVRVFVNPEVDITDYDQSTSAEACGSYVTPVAYRLRHRHLIIAAKSLGGLSFFLDTADPKFSDEVSELLSYRIQHEMEHLDGLNARAEPQMEQGDVAFPFVPCDLMPSLVSL